MDIENGKKDEEDMNATTPFANLQHCVPNFIFYSISFCALLFIIAIRSRDFYINIHFSLRHFMFYNIDE